MVQSSAPPGAWPYPAFLVLPPLMLVTQTTSDYFPRDAQTSQKSRIQTQRANRKGGSPESPLPPLACARPQPPAKHRAGPRACPPACKEGAGAVAGAWPYIGRARGRAAAQSGDASPALPNATRAASGGSENPGRRSLWNVVIDLRTCGDTGGTRVSAARPGPAQHPACAPHLPWGSRPRADGSLELALPHADLGPSHGQATCRALAARSQGGGYRNRPPGGDALAAAGSAQMLGPSLRPGTSPAARATWRSWLPELPGAPMELLMSHRRVRLPLPSTRQPRLSPAWALPRPPSLPSRGVTIVPASACNPHPRRHPC